MAAVNRGVAELEAEITQLRDAKERLLARVIRLQGALWEIITQPCDCGHRWEHGRNCVTRSRAVDIAVSTLRMR